MPRLALKVAGLLYDGWKTVDVETSMERIAGTFRLEITERWPSEQRSFDSRSTKTGRLE